MSDNPSRVAYPRHGHVERIQTPVPMPSSIPIPHSTESHHVATSPQQTMRFAGTPGKVAPIGTSPHRRRSSSRPIKMDGDFFTQTFSNALELGADQVDLPWVVQKFGGTSVGSAERMLNVADIVKSSAESRKVVVVLSAMSSQIKSQGTTSRLLEACEQVLTPASQKYLDIVDLIEHDHLKAVYDAIRNPKCAEECAVKVKAECQKLKSFMEAAEIIDEISPRSRDIIISAGEKLSALMFSYVLMDQGIPSVYVNLERLIDRHFEENEINQSFYDYIQKRLKQVIEEKVGNAEAKMYGEEIVEVDGPNLPFVVPVVTGYLGPVPGSILNTIGRGYTDLTAALCAVGLGAEELQIWKEVDGIFTADPRKAPLARLLPYISPDEAAELTYYGSEVIHPFTMEQVIRASIPIRIKNTFNPPGRGTVVYPDGYPPDDEIDELDQEEIISTFTQKPISIHRPSRRFATAVTIKDDVTVLNVHSNRKSVSHGFLAHIFRTLDKYGIVVDLISTSEVHVSMALGANVKERNLELALGELRKLGTVDVSPNMSILSLVGRLMKNSIGISGKMFSVLSHHRINIEMISQGASEINISCVIEKHQGPIALRAVHDACVLGIHPEGGNSTDEGLE